MDSRETLEIGVRNLKDSAYHNKAQSVCANLRQILRSESSLTFLMEAHSGLSAKIVEEAGFAGIWASGLSIATSLGLRDCNEASWTQVLTVLEYMSDACSIPILVDGDTGYGNYNNVRILVRKLCQRAIAGVCIEDKIFPKTNSFLGENQPLATVEEFKGKIKAAKDTQSDPNFNVVARVEALIAGRGLNEAVDRASAYAWAGADAILIHSKRSDISEIKSFMDRWDLPCPIVIVPTKYYRTPTEVFSKIGISTVIWANHLLRSSLSAMQITAQTVAAERTLLSIEERIAPLSEVFRIVDNDELDQADSRYLPR